MKDSDHNLNIDYKNHIRVLLLTPKGHMERVYAIPLGNNQKSASSPYYREVNRELRVLEKETPITSPLLDYMVEKKRESLLARIPKEVEDSPYHNTSSNNGNSWLAFLTEFIESLNLLKSRFSIPVLSINKQKLRSIAAKIAKSGQTELDVFLDSVLTDLQTPNFITFLK